MAWRGGSTWLFEPLKSTRSGGSEAAYFGRDENEEGLLLPSHEECPAPRVEPRRLLRQLEVDRPPPVSHLVKSRFPGPPGRCRSDRRHSCCLNRSGSGWGSDVLRVWWSHLAGQMMLKALKETSVPRSHPAEFRRKVLALVDAGQPVRRIAHDPGISLDLA